MLPLCLDGVDDVPSPPVSMSALSMIDASPSHNSCSNIRLSPMALGSPLLSPPMSSNNAGQDSTRAADRRAQRAWPSTWGHAPAVGTPSPTSAAAAAGITIAPITPIPAAAAFATAPAVAANAQPVAANAPTGETLPAAAAALLSAVAPSSTATTHLFSERVSPPRRPVPQQHQQEQLSSSYGSCVPAVAAAPVPSRMSLSRSLLRLHNVSLCLSGSVQQLVLHKHWMPRWAVLDSAAHTGPALHVYTSEAAASRKQKPLQTIVLDARTEFKELGHGQPQPRGCLPDESPFFSPAEHALAGGGGYAFLVLNRSARQWMVLSTASESQRDEWMDSFAQQMERVSAACTPAGGMADCHELTSALFGTCSLTSPVSALAVPLRYSPSPRGGASAPVEACMDCSKPFSRWGATAHPCGHCRNRFCAACSSSEVRLGTEHTRVCNPCHRMLVALKRLQLQRLAVSVASSNHNGIGSALRVSLAGLGSPLATPLPTARGGNASPVYSTASTHSPLSSRSSFASPSPPFGPMGNRDQSPSPSLGPHRSSRAESGSDREPCCSAHARTESGGSSRFPLATLNIRTPCATPRSPCLVTQTHAQPASRRASVTLQLASPRDGATRRQMRLIAKTLGISLSGSSKSAIAIKKRAAPAAAASSTSALSHKPHSQANDPSCLPSRCSIM